MKIADFRIQTTAPDAPSSSSVIGVYANTSGILLSKDSAGNVRTVGQVFNNLLGGTVGGTLTTGFTYIKDQNGGLVTGVVYGTSGTYTWPQFLGVPSKWLAVVGPSGEKLAVPGFAYV